MTTIKGLREIEPYVAGSQPSGENLIKLNTNENAYGPSPKVAEVFHSLMSINCENIRPWIKNHYALRLLSNTVLNLIRLSLVMVQMIFYPWHF